MSLITDKVFYNALRSNTAIMQAVSGRIENVAIPVPEDQLLNEPVPYLIIAFDSLQNDGFSKDNSFEGCNDKVQVSILAAAETREQLGDIMQEVRQAIIEYFEDTENHEWDDYELVPNNYTFSASAIAYDDMKPCYFQSLIYNCDTNP